MSAFELFDNVWFFVTDYGKDKWYGSTIIYPTSRFLELKIGTIVAMSEPSDYIHLYIEPYTQIVHIPYALHDDILYFNKNDAIDAMIKCMEALR